MSKKKYYGIAIGRNIGVYDNWDDAKVQVDKFTGAKYKGFATYEEAHSFVFGSDSNSSLPKKTRL